MAPYENQSPDTLKQKVTKEFKNIDVVWINDLSEITFAWIKVCEQMLKDIKSDKNNIYWPWALKPITDLQFRLKKEYMILRHYTDIFTNNKDKINQIAQRIDNAENETLKRLQKNKTTQESRNYVSQTTKSNNGNAMFTMEWGSDIRKQTWNIIFTKSANPVKIHKACEWLFTNPDNAYTIDYSKCTNQSIKSRMLSVIWTDTCILTYDKNLKTYVLRNSKWEPLQIRARIREWVKLIPAWVRKRNAYVQQKKENENAGKIDRTQISGLTKEMIKDMPSLKKYDKEPIYQESLFIATENRITSLLKKAKRLWYELDPECVTRKHFWYGHMELHLNSWSSETSRTFWNSSNEINAILNKPNISKTLFDYIDDNEWEYKTYLTKRIKQKWQELEWLTKVETTTVGTRRAQNLQKRFQELEEKKNAGIALTNEEQKELEKLEKQEAHKNETLYWIWLFEKMIENYRESTWDSWLSNDDRRLVKIKQLLANAKASINDSDILDDAAITKNFINPIRNEWSQIKNIQKTTVQWYWNTGWRVETNPFYDKQYNYLKSVFFWEKGNQITAIRELWAYGRFFDNTETSYLAEEIGWNEDLQVKDSNIQSCLNKITSWCSMSPENPKVKWRYDNTFAAAKKWTDSLITLFVGRWWLPKNWKSEEKEVRKCMDNLKDKLNSINDQCNNISLSVDDMIKTQHEKKLKLEQKENKTEDDMRILQSLVYLEDNPNEAREIYQKTIEINNIESKYWNLWQIVRWWLLSALGELWWWITWKNADIYNDIKWYWWFDLSDENAKVAWDLIWDILEEVVILAVAIAIGAVTAWTWTAVIIWARATRWWAKVAKYTKYITKLANKLSKPIWNIIKRTKNRAKTTKIWQRTVKTAERMRNTKLWKNVSKIRAEQNATKAAISQKNRAEILQLWRKENKTLWEMYKLWTLVNKEWGMWIKAVSAIFEWTWFHLSNTVIHNAINWVDLTTWLSDFEWYVQSIAFLSILKAVGQPIQNLTQASLTSALWKKISANTVWKILQNIGSVAWEFWALTVTDETLNVVFEWELKELTVEDAIHSIGMILWLRAYWKIKQIANLKIKEYNRNKKELKVEIDGKDFIVNENMLNKPSKKETHEKRKTELERRRKELESRRQDLLKQREANWRSLDLKGNNMEKIKEILKTWNIITIDGLKYKFNWIKNGKAEFIIEANAKKSADMSWKKYSEKVEVSSMEELLDPRFNLEPWKKGTNSGRYQKLNEIIDNKTEPLDRLQNKIKNKKSEITTLEEEVARLEKWNITTAKNDYFEQHKNEIVGRNVRIDGVKYRAEHINKDGSIQFKEVDWNRNFTVSSFKQLAEKWQVNWFSDWVLADWSPRRWSESLTKSESDNHQAIRDLISWESEYLSSRNIEQTLSQKRSELQTAQRELKWLEDKLPASQSRQQAINERARKWAEINKELWKVERELNWVNRDLWEANRLINKYQNETTWSKEQRQTSWEEPTSRQQKQESRTTQSTPREQATERKTTTTDKTTTERSQAEEKILDEALEKESKLVESRLNSESNHKNIKLDWVTKAQFETWVFIEWVHRRFKNLTLKPNMKIPRKFLIKLRNKLANMRKKWWKNLSDYHKNLIDKYNQYLNRKLAKKQRKVAIKKQEIEKLEQQRKQQEQQRRQQEQQINWNERPERWINTERREMREVQRNSDVVAIWDLHGEYVALKWNMEYAWLAKEINWHLEWTGWNKKVVFQWDILGDRWTNWLRIIQEIHQLREQARKQWWDIDIIVGNHDDFMISYLTWRNGAHWNWLEISMLWWQWRWLTELAKFIWKDIWDFENLYGRETREAILQAMRNSPEWRIILEEICSMKIVSQVDDVLYIHTNPTDAMLKFLTSSWKWNIQQMINAINTKYQNYLRTMLLWEWKISDEWLREFNWLSDLFLHTSNRTTSRQLDYYQKLKDSWINMISHGHSWGSENIHNMDVVDYHQQFLYKNNQANIWWIKIVDTDYSYWKWWKNRGQHSVSIVKKEWWVNYMWDNVAYANLEHPIWSEVYVKRTAWWESKARVESYNPKTKEYKVVWEEWWKILSKTVKSESLRNVHFEKILDKSRTFELPLKDHVCEYIRIVKEWEYPDRQKYSYKNWKLTEDPNGCYIKLNEWDITPEEWRECFLRGLKISSELMNWQKNRAVLSSWSLFLNIESYGKLWWDIDIATDVTAFNNVALQRWSDGLTTLERFQRDWKIRDLIFTKIDHSVIDIKNMSEHEITELIEKWDIRVEFNIPDAKWNTINCEFFPEPEGYWLIQLWTPRADGGLLSYEIEWNLIKTVSPELAAMSYMINLAHEFKNNSLDAWNKTKEKAKDKGKRNIPKLKDSVRMNNFFQYLESANIRTVSDMINYIDRTIANYEQQHGKKIEIEVTEGDKKVKKTIDMSAYLRKWLDKLPDVKKLLQDVEIDYQKTLGNSRIKALRWTETKLSFNQFMNETLKIKEELFNLKDVEKTPQKRDEIMREIYNLQKMVNINDPKSFSYYYEIYQLKTNFLYKVFGKNN